MATWFCFVEKASPERSNLIFLFHMTPVNKFSLYNKARAILEIPVTAQRRTVDKFAASFLTNEKNPAIYSHCG
jgi:hypothetical protein